MGMGFSGPRDDESEEEYLNDQGLNWEDLDEPKEATEWDGPLDE